MIRKFRPLLLSSSSLFPSSTRSRRRRSLTFQVEKETGRNERLCYICGDAIPFTLYSPLSPS